MAMMTIAQIMAKMIAFSVGSTHDIDHLIKVWAYAKAIGELEGLDPETQYILEAAAITHDIACPLCRRKYGHADGKLQEKEGDPLVRDFLEDTGMTADQISRIAFLVAHHHTLTGVDGPDYQILLEADYIVNATENEYTDSNISNFMENVMRTQSGKKILLSVFSNRNIHGKESESQ